MTPAAVLYAQHPLYLSYLPGKSERLVLSFSGVGLPGEEIPAAEAARLSGWEGENHVLFIVDASRSWMNAPGLVENLLREVQALVARIKPARIVAFGNSMGGTAALIFAALFRVDAVLAISPQYSVNPEVMPKESRWQDYVGRIGSWRFPSAPDLTALPGEVMILHGSVNSELRHARRFSQAANIRSYVFKDFAHGLAARLKRKAHLQPILAAMILGDMAAASRAATAAGGVLLTEFQRQHKAAKLARLTNDPI